MKVYRLKDRYKENISIFFYMEFFFFFSSKIKDIHDQIDQKKLILDSYGQIDKKLERNISRNIEGQ